MRNTLVSAGAEGMSKFTRRGLLAALMVAPMLLPAQASTSGMPIADLIQQFRTGLALHADACRRLDALNEQLPPEPSVWLGRQSHLDPQTGMTKWTLRQAFFPSQITDLYQTLRAALPGVNFDNEEQALLADLERQNVEYDQWLISVGHRSACEAEEAAWLSLDRILVDILANEPTDFAGAKVKAEFLSGLLRQERPLPEPRFA